jgi:hypothetical protein
MPEGAGLTLRGLMLRVSQDVGKAAQPVEDDAVADIPTDPAFREECRQAINDALGDMQRRRAEWNVLRRVLSVTIDPAVGDPARIGGRIDRVRIPGRFRLVPAATWIAHAEQAGWLRLAVRPAAEVAAMQSTQPCDGWPRIVGFGFSDPSSASVGTEMFIWPRPSRQLVITGEVRTQVGELVELDDLSPFGPEHDQTLVRMAVARLQRRNADLALRDWHKADAAEALTESVAIDEKLTPASLGTIVDGAEYSSNLEVSRLLGMTVSGVLVYQHP